jgi:hypothetical protein
MKSTIARTVTARMVRARVTAAVRRTCCPRCQAPAYGPCQVDPPGDCLKRWVAAERVGRISRHDLWAAIGRVTSDVFTLASLVPERAQRAKRSQGVPDDERR